MTCSTTPEGRGTSPIIDDFKFLLKPRRADEPDVWPFMLLLQSNPHSDGYSLLPIFIVLQEIIGDTALFLQQASDEIMRLVSLNFLFMPRCLDHWTRLEAFSRGMLY
jgi:hypothetical protein